MAFYISGTYTRGEEKGTDIYVVYILISFHDFLPFLYRWATCPVVTSSLRNTRTSRTREPANTYVTNSRYIPSMKTLWYSALHWWTNYCNFYVLFFFCSFILPAKQCLEYCFDTLTCLPNSPSSDVQMIISLIVQPREKQNDWDSNAYHHAEEVVRLEIYHETYINLFYLPVVGVNLILSNCFRTPW